MMGRLTQIWWFDAAGQITDIWEFERTWPKGFRRAFIRRTLRSTNPLYKRFEFRYVEPPAAILPAHTILKSARSPGPADMHGFLPGVRPNKEQ